MTRTITINPQWSSWHDFLIALPERMDSAGEYVYGGARNLIKNFTAPDGTIVVVKRYHRPHFANKLVYSWGIRHLDGDPWLKTRIDDPDHEWRPQYRGICVYGVQKPDDRCDGR